MNISKVKVILQVSSGNFTFVCRFLEFRIWINFSLCQLMCHIWGWHRCHSLITQRCWTIFKSFLFVNSRASRNRIILRITHLLICHLPLFSYWLQILFTRTIITNCQCIIVIKGSLASLHHTDCIFGAEHACWIWVVTLCSRNWYNTCLVAQLLPPPHHFFKHFFLSWFRICLILLTYNCVVARMVS